MNILNKILIACCFLIASLSLKSQEVIISNNATINALPGTSIILANGMNLVNHSVSGILSGTFIFQGTLPQNISGDYPVEFTNLTVEQGGLVSLLNDVKVNTALNLTNGFVDLLNNNLTLLSSATLNGSFSETDMIVAEGSGKLGYEITGNGSYLFPIGDTSAVDEYSPVSLVFNSGTYTNAVISANLKNQKHPQNSSTTDYLKRYWTISQTGITGFACDVNFTYTNADIQGSESNIYGAKWNGSFWTPLNKASMNSISGNVIDFSDFTGGELSVVGSKELIQDNVEIISNGNLIIIKSKDSFKLKSAEVYNKLGQKVYVKDLSKSNYNEIDLGKVRDIYLVRILSDNQSFTKKVLVD